MADAAASPAADSFTGYQSELRGIIGGSSEEIGGAAGASTQGATYDGAELFGASGVGGAFETGLAAMPSVNVAVPNLRQGAVLGLIDQGPDGTFSMTASSPGAAATISSAAAQVSSGALAVAGSQEQLDLASTGATGASGAMGSPADAASSTAAAARAIAGNWSGALAANSGRSLQSILGLLQVG